MSGGACCTDLNVTPLRNNNIVLNRKFEQKKVNF